MALDPATSLSTNRFTPFILLAFVAVTACGGGPVELVVRDAGPDGCEYDAPTEISAGSVDMLVSSSGLGHNLARRSEAREVGRLTISCVYGDFDGVVVSMSLPSWLVLPEEQKVAIGLVSFRRLPSSVRSPRWLRMDLCESGSVPDARLRGGPSSDIWPAVSGISASSSIGISSNAARKSSRPRLPIGRLTPGRSTRGLPSIAVRRHLPDKDSNQSRRPHGWRGIAP